MTVRLISSSEPEDFTSMFVALIASAVILLATMYGKATRNTDHSKSMSTVEVGTK